jgi:hypothetical protein
VKVYRYRGSTPPVGDRNWRSNVNGIVAADSIRDALDRLEKAHPGVEVHMLNHEGELVS